MKSLPHQLPCFTTAQEYSGIPEYFRERPRGGCYIRTPEEEEAYRADLAQRMARLNARLDEIFASPEGQAYLNMRKK